MSCEHIKDDDPINDIQKHRNILNNIDLNLLKIINNKDLDLESKIMENHENNKTDKNIIFQDLDLIYKKLEILIKNQEYEAKSLENKRFIIETENNIQIHKHLIDHYILKNTNNKLDILNQLRQNCPRAPYDVIVKIIEEFDVTDPSRTFEILKNIYIKDINITKELILLTHS